MTVGDPDRAVILHHHAGRSIHMRGISAGHAGSANGQQDFSVRAEFHDGVTDVLFRARSRAWITFRRAVGHPDVALFIHEKPVWESDQSLSEAFDHLAIER